MPTAYKVLRGTLEHYVEEQTGVHPNEQTELYEELALIRHAASTAVDEYQLSHEKHLSTPTAATKEELLEKTEIMTLRLREVATFAEKTAKITQASTESLSVHNLQYLIKQMGSILFEALGDDAEMINKIDQQFRGEIKLMIQDQQGSGTNITPDQDVQEMDGTVPLMGEAHIAPTPPENNNTIDVEVKGK